MKTLILLSLILSGAAFAHGENKPGPHNGFIRMPGSFHTELLLSNNQSLIVYLMDVNNQNPMTEHSSVAMTVNGKNLDCFSKKDFFECSSKSQLDFKTGKIVVKPIRNQVKGTEAVYDLPLSLEKPAAVDHNAHH